jgi:hypothetical protein
VKRKLPEAVLEQLRKAGRARAAKMTTEDRRCYALQGWKTRIKNAKKNA